MAYKLATAYVDIQARMGDLEAQLGTRGQGLVSAFLGSFSNISPIIAATGSIAALAVASRGFMHAADEAYFAEARLESIIKATGNAAKISKAEVLSFSAELQKKGIFGNTEITRATTKLLQMRAVTRDTFKEVLALSADVSAAGFGSVETAATMLGRALADPARGIQRLRALGVVFTKAEQDKIKALAESNEMLKAQRLILDKLQGAVGGTNAALAATPAGQWKQLQNTLSDIAEEFGKRIYPFALKVANLAVDISKGIFWVFDRAVQVNEALGGWPVKLAAALVILHQIPAVLGSINQALLLTNRLLTIEGSLRWWADMSTQLKLMPQLIKNMSTAMHQFLFGYLRPVSMGFVKMPGMIAKVRAAIVALSAAATTGTLFTGWGAILVAIGAILAGLVAIGVYASKFQKVQEAWGRTWIAIKMLFSEILNAMGEVAKAFDPILVAIAGFGFTDMIAFLRNGIPNAAAFMANEMTRQLALVISWVRVLRNHLKDVGNLMIGIVAKDLKKIAEAVGSLSELGREAGIEFQAVLREIARRQKAMNTPAQSSVPDAGVKGGPTAEFKGGLIGFQEAWKGIQEAFIKQDDPAKRTADGIEGLHELAAKQLEEQVKTNTILGNAEGGIADA